MHNISKEFGIEYAHRLQLPYKSPCKNIHGHSGRVVIKIEAPILDENSMVIDFSELKIFQKSIEKLFDHVLILNESDSLVKLLKGQKIHTLTSEPTAEALSECISRLLTTFLKDKDIIFVKTEVVFYETVKNNASFIYQR